MKAVYDDHNIKFKNFAVCCDQIEIVDITDEDEFILLACDGLFDVMTNQAAVDFVKTEMADHGDVSKDLPSRGHSFMHFSFSSGWALEENQNNLTNAMACGIGALVFPAAGTTNSRSIVEDGGRGLGLPRQCEYPGGHGARFVITEVGVQGR